MTAKIEKAVRDCELVQNAWTKAHAALNGSVQMNGYGIYVDESHLRRKLEDAKKNIEDALKALNQIKFPTNADYAEDDK